MVREQAKHARTSARAARARTLKARDAARRELLRLAQEDLGPDDPRFRVAQKVYLDASAAYARADVEVLSEIAARYEEAAEDEMEE